MEVGVNLEMIFIRVVLMVSTQNLKLTFTRCLVQIKPQPLLDSIFVRRWEGSNFSDESVTISGKYHDDGQSDGFNDHATRYNGISTKVVEIQDTYGGFGLPVFYQIHY